MCYDTDLSEDLAASLKMEAARTRSVKFSMLTFVHTRVMVYLYQQLCNWQILKIETASCSQSLRYLQQHYMSLQKPSDIYWKLHSNMF